jgi:hypothetical protein
VDAIALGLPSCSLVAPQIILKLMQ